MRLSLIIMFVMASVVGLHFFGIISLFQENVSSPKKMTAVKPESFRNRVKEPTPRKTVYTFFETLNDSTMTQYVDLKGGLMPALLSSKKEISVPSKIATVLPLVKKTARLDPALKIGNTRKSKSAESVTPEIKEQYRYVVQMGSFRDESRADSLISLLKKNEFDAFLTQTEIADQAWHRVFLGRYADEQKAQKAASLARSQFNLNAKVRKTD